MTKRRIIAILGGVLGLLLIIVILGYNKARMAARSQPNVISSYPVTIATVAKEHLNTILSVVGVITANNDVAIVSETQGKVVSVFADVGDFLEAGSPLVQVDDEVKKASFSAAEVNYEKAKKDLERFESLYKESSVSDTQIESARMAYKAAEAQYLLARRQYRDTKITTLISGLVTSRTVDVGNYVQSGTVIGNVVDISKLKVKLNVAEKDVFHLKVGGKVRVTTDVYPGVHFEGSISNISAKADEAHSYPVEVSMANSKQHPLKAGMFGRVEFNIIQDEALTIPREALVGSLKNPQVFVVEGGKALLRDLVAGEEIGTRVVILNGLHPGETVVLNGQNNLTDSATVTVLK